MAYFSGFWGNNLIIFLYHKLEPTTLYPQCMRWIVIDHGCEQSNVTGCQQKTAQCRAMRSSYRPTWSKVHQLYLHQLSNCFMQQWIRPSQSKLTNNCQFNVNIVVVFRALINGLLLQGCNSSTARTAHVVINAPSRTPSLPLLGLQQSSAATHGELLQSAHREIKNVKELQVSQNRHLSSFGSLPD